jgi:hypothetical protein
MVRPRLVSTIRAVAISSRIHKDPFNRWLSGEGASLPGA